MRSTLPIESIALLDCVFAEAALLLLPLLLASGGCAFAADDHSDIKSILSTTDRAGAHARTASIRPSTRSNIASSHHTHGVVSTPGDGHGLSPSMGWVGLKYCYFSTALCVCYKSHIGKNKSTHLNNDDVVIRMSHRDSY